MWQRILDAFGCSFALLRRVCWPALEECYVLLLLLFLGFVHSRSRKHNTLSTWEETGGLYVILFYFIFLIK
jgi:hypothetical protein